MEFTSTLFLFLFLPVFLLIYLVSAQRLRLPIVLAASIIFLFSAGGKMALPTLLMFHDSFGAYYLNDYLSMNFGKSHFVHLRNTPQYLNQQAIQQLKPDVIIIQIVERDLDLLTNTLVNFGSQ